LFEILGCEHIGGSAVTNTTFVETENIVGMLPDYVELVSDENYGETTLLPKAMEEGVNSLSTANVDTGGRLVEDKGIWIVY
jgi:hypothetical protein